MMRSLLAVAIVIGGATFSSAQYPYNYGNGYALPTVPQLPGTYMSGPGYIVGGGQGASLWVTPNFAVQSYNPYWMQQRQMYQPVYRGPYQPNYQPRYNTYRRP